ncbi:MAG TPA: DUF3341 domain-containing protein [Myxococcota bacterium]|jgi:hypothetical protein
MNDAPRLLIELSDIDALHRVLAIAEQRGVRAEAVSPVALDTEPAGARFIAAAALAGGVFGGSASIAIEIWTNAIDYPLDVGGRPLLSIPAFIPLTFEGAVLCAALSTVFAFLWRASLPRLAHPAFHWPDIERATSDRFFVALYASDDERAALESALADVPRAALNTLEAPARRGEP